MSDLATLHEAAKNNNTFEHAHRYAKELMAGGYNHLDTSQMLAEATGQSFFSHEDTHVFTFTDGVIILSGMDGMIAYMGTQIL